MKTAERHLIVLTALAQYWVTYGKAPGMATLAELADYTSANGLRYAVKALVTDGHIEPMPYRGSGNRRQTDWPKLTRKGIAIVSGRAE